MVPVLPYPIIIIFMYSIRIFYRMNIHMLFLKQYSIIVALYSVQSNNLILRDVNVQG
jgi:hypothetical protein